jgi:hypothetical protein
MNKLFEKLKERWEVDHFWQVLLIFFIFSISGMSVLYVRKLAFYLLGFDAQTPLWKEATTWLLVVVPSYQALFLLYGTLLGQFEFVWRFEKKNFRRLKKLACKLNPR